MKHARIAILSLLVAASAGCTKENAAFCCLTAEDCAAKGVTDGLRECADGLACVGNTCVAPTCTSGVCAASAPVCDTVTDQCVGCTDSSACAIFAGTSVCDPSSGGCVECLASADCPSTRPICDGRVCRTCSRDTECASGACAQDGTCVDADRVVYLSPTGTDALPCDAQAPCRSLDFADDQTTEARNHIVFQPGDYSEGATIGGTAATTISLHGHGATVTGGSSDFAAIQNQVPTNILDLTIVNPEAIQATSLRASAALSLWRVRLRGTTGLSVEAPVTAEDLDITATEVGIRNYATLTVNRATITGGSHGITSSSADLDLTNVLIHDTTGAGILATSTGGRFYFGTIARTGEGDTGPAGIDCVGGTFKVESSIVWTVTTVARPSLSAACLVASSIVGPEGVVGAMNVNPLFVDGLSDFHLSGGSPARDVSNTGPDVDFEGAPRPAGPRYDLGADEVP